MTYNLLKTIAITCLITTTSLAQELEVKTVTSMGLDAQVKSVTKERKDFNLKEQRYGYSSGEETYTFNAAGTLQFLKEVNDTGNKTGTYFYKNHSSGAKQLSHVNYLGNHVKRGRREYSKSFLYSKTNPDSIYDYEVSSKFIQATGKLQIDTIKTINQVINYSKNGNIERLKQFSNGKLYKEYYYSNNKEVMNLYSGDNLLWKQTRTLKNGLVQKEVRENPEGKYMLGKKYMYNDNGHLIKVYLIDEKEKELELIEQANYLYKNNYWVVKCYQLYEKSFYNPEKLKIEKRTIILKNNTKIDATDAEIEAFIKQNEAIATKP
ncbi:hypothetical protein ACFQ1R_11170 [Mariniflexile jejuense]|uniref:Antitoxin component YwqK of YwqJK toxin-antitoxin module n=1 Tax=Mariniflexile jejuense TaxID=1173582 RepID=A0ABW3JJJ5_9FLAO